MAWLRLDDAFAQHPKILQLTDREYRVWTAVLLYCARYQTEGLIRRDAFRIVGLDLKTAAKLVRVELLEEDRPGCWIIHDWDEYNPPRFDEGELLERVAAAAERYPDASANELARVVGGQRKATLEAVRRFRSGSQAGSREPGTGGSRNQAGTGSRAGRRARPVPSQTTTPTGSSSSGLDQNGTRATTPPTDGAPSRPARDIAADLIRNTGTHIPANDLLGAIRSALTNAQGTHSRYDELTPDDLTELADQHADLLAANP